MITFRAADFFLSKYTTKGKRDIINARTPSSRFCEIAGEKVGNGVGSCVGIVGIGLGHGLRQKNMLNLSHSMSFQLGINGSNLNAT